MTPSLHRAERGATTLAVTLMLLAAMLLVLVAANRNLLVELRQSSNQSESTVAFEAAEAGLAWATALLNDATPRGDDCRAAADGTSFRERHLDTTIARPACSAPPAGPAAAPARQRPPWTTRPAPARPSRCVLHPARSPACCA